MASRENKNRENGFCWAMAHWRQAILVLYLALLVFCFACSAETEGKQKKTTAAPVTIGSVIKKDVPVQIVTIGNVEPYSSVAIKSIVNGQLIKTAFKEGQGVEKGDLLLVVDPRPFEAALKQAEAILDRDLSGVKQARANRVRNESQQKHAEAILMKDQVQAKTARVQAKRYGVLAANGNVSKDQYDQVQTNADALNAVVLADEASLEDVRATLPALEATLEHAQAAVRASRAGLQNAKLQLGYCYIHSPLDGRTGNLYVKEGNIIEANDAVLVEINQVHPIYVAFSVPEQDLWEIRRHMALGELKVEAWIPGDRKWAEQGGLTFVDNAVDRTTGTIRLKGTFFNEKNRLWPGQFVDVVITLDTEKNATVVPSQAVQMGQQGPYAFVVTPELTAEYRKLILGRSLNGETVVAEGLTPGERVVTDGYLRLVPGVKVEIKSDSRKVNPTS
ncbi:MAG: efflux RND transporter periplasmic adaptor subunit [Desulfobacteraceae bacterium]|nr:efflux RND transporter periplasmic adaptor subunit [Desulfobacteraceae bacterium]